MESLTFLGLSLVLTGGALWVIGCLVNLFNAGQKPLSLSQGLNKLILEEARIISDHKLSDLKKAEKELKKNKLNGEAREWRKETKITLAPSRRLCEEAVKHLN
jgi:hypothetical protein